MEWKEDVTVIRCHGYALTRKEKSCCIPKNKEYLVRAMDMGITDDQELVKIIMKKENEDLVEAELSLAAFAVKYQEYIADKQRQRQYMFA